MNLISEEIPSLPRAVWLITAIYLMNDPIEVSAPPNIRAFFKPYLLRVILPSIVPGRYKIKKIFASMLTADTVLYGEWAK